MNNKGRYLLLFFALTLFNYGCTRDEIGDDPLVTIQGGQQVHSSSLVQGMMRVQVTDGFSEKLESLADKSGVIATAQVKSVDESIFSMGVTRMERTFPYAGEFEARTRKSGLHLWYDVYFDENQSLTKAGETLSSIDGVKSVEYRPKTVKLFDDVVYASSGTSEPAAASLPFDDPKLVDQWHYFNDGTESNSVSGCDINVFPAWEKFSTGKNTVIVSVVDGGIDYSHEDLAANMWSNPSQTGDLRYGYNFVSNSYAVTPDNHGTHVAGVVSAVNNNGKGVSGVAGGNYSKGIQGVLLMSCQVFEGDYSAEGAKAIKWSADHGAVISQNSWGYDGAISTPRSDIAAFQYFIDYAGMDANGKQVGPMAGGLVIFAAGNDNESVGYPGADVMIAHFISVTAVAADYRKAYYSNYGRWTDIAAPGGDTQKGTWILSTIQNNAYGYMQGTSMACPHVSGVAALIVSYLGKDGFTNTQLEERLLEYANPVIDGYNIDYALGSGLVDAYASMNVSGGDAPGKVTDFSLSALSNNVNIRAVIPADSDDGKPSTIIAYYDTVSFDSRTIRNAESKSFKIPDSLSAGDTFRDVIRGLKFNKEYYVALLASDLAGNESEISELKTVTTLNNNPPVIIPKDGLSATVKAFQTATLNFEVTDMDQHSYTVDVVPGSKALSYTQTDNLVQLIITGKDDEAGTYKGSLKVTDEYGLSDMVEVSYTILVNTPPTKIKDIENVVFGATSDPAVVFSLNQFFKDDDGEDLSYSLKISNPNVTSANITTGRLQITPLSLGYSDLTVTASDVRGESVSSVCKVLVRDASNDVDIYPNPVKDTLKIRAGAETPAHVTVMNVMGSKIFDADVTLSPFSPAEVDFSKKSGGTYTVSVSYSDKTITKTIVKL